MCTQDADVHRLDAAELGAMATVYVYATVYSMIKGSDESMKEGAKDI